MIEDLGRFRQRIELWQGWHPYELRCKQLEGPEAIWDAVMIDIASSLVVAGSIRTIDAADLVDELSLDDDVTADIRSRTIGDRVDHIGFRIRSPLDVYFEVLPTWVESVGWDLKGTKRFSPSPRFQERVGSTVEVAQAWLGTADDQVELELFDIHQPLGGDVSALGKMSAELLNRDGPYPPVETWQPFRADQIWHYGILLATTDDVALAHGALTRGVLHRADLGLRNDDVVVNLWHGSHHTKIAKVGGGLEIEFLSYIDDWGQR